MKNIVNQDPGESIPNIKFKPEIEKLKNQLGDDVAEKDLVSYLLYPKVFEDFYNHKKKVWRCFTSTH